MTKEHFVTRFRWPIIIGCIAIAAGMGLQLKNIKIDADPVSLLPKTMPSRQNTQAIEDVFGSNDMLFYILESDDVLAEKTLVRIRELSHAMGRIKGIDKVLSLIDTKRITGEDGAMIVTSAIETIPQTVEQREILRAQLRDNEMAYEMVVSKDFRYTAILLTLDPAAVKADVFKEAQKIVREIPGEEIVHVGGLPAFQTIIAKDITRDLIVLIPVALLLILFVLYGFFRQLRGIALPFAVVVLSTVFGLGILPMMGWKMTLVSAILPLMVVAFANNYGIYLVARYQELSRLPGPHTGKQLAAEVYRGLNKPVLFSGLTTMVGILGLLTHVMVPAKQIGIAAAIAIGFSLIASLWAIPAVLSLMKVQSYQQKNTRVSFPFLSRILGTGALLINRKPKTILIATVFVAILAIAGAFRLKVDANQENLFAKNHPITKSTQLINQYFGGSQSLALMFEGDIKDPQLLNEMAALKKELVSFPGVGQVSSMADVLRIMSKALNNKGESGYDAIPQTRDAVAQYLELYSMNGDPADFEKLVDFNYEKAQVVVRITDGSTPSIQMIEKKIRAFAAHNGHIKTIGGYASVFVELAVTLINGQISSILFAFIIIVILVMVQFRSVAAGVLAAIPLSFSTILGFGFMGASGMPVDIVTAMIASIVLGCGVDFSIQFLWKYRDMRQNGLGHRESIQETMVTTGRAIAFNSTCVVSGFLALFLSSMPPLHSFVILFSILTLACMLSTLLVIPAVCLVWKPAFLNPLQKKVSSQPSSKED